MDTKNIADSPSVTVSYFGSCTPAAAPGTYFAYMDVGREREQGRGSDPSTDSYGYRCQCKHAPRTTADAPDSEASASLLTPLTYIPVGKASASLLTPLTYSPVGKASASLLTPLTYIPVGKASASLLTPLTYIPVGKILVRCAG